MQCYAKCFVSNIKTQKCEFCCQVALAIYMRERKNEALTVMPFLKENICSKTMTITPTLQTQILISRYTFTIMRKTYTA